MVGRVGQDQFGANIIDRLKETGVDAARVIRDASVGSGIAMIIVGGDGDNSIVIAQQANLKLSAQDVEDAKPLIAKADIVLLQMEVPMETNIAAAKAAKAAGVTVALNPAPAPEDGRLPDELMRNLDIIVPNQTEATQLTGIDVNDSRNAASAAQALQAMGPRIVIITLGADGAFISDGVNETYIQSFPVEVVDTTAAGDAFCGAFAASYASGAKLADAVRFGCGAGALACTRLGAEPSLPMMQDVAALISASPTGPIG
jgi:ribokinase